MHTIMTRFGIIIGSLVVTTLALLIMGGVPSCKTPEQTAKLMRLIDIGLQVAANKGVITQGDSLLIGSGVAILTSADSSKEDKILKLSEIGLTEAVKEGVINSGDSILIKDAINVIVTTPPPAPTEIPQLTDGGGK
ncbi:MAG: hypothetical protein U0984_07630 [Prosthecobacter sp.]|nr:hypothetical protein [Prosthecobacter sp.]